MTVIDEEQRTEDMDLTWTLYNCVTMTLSPAVYSGFCVFRHC